MKIVSVSKNSWAFLITLMVLGLGYVFYFFVYVKNNETAYYQKAHRVLEQLGANIYATNNNFEGQLLFYSPETSDDIDVASGDSSTDKEKIAALHTRKNALSKISNLLYDKVKQISVRAESIQIEIDTLKKQNSKKNKSKQFNRLYQLENQKKQTDKLLEEIKKRRNTYEETKNGIDRRLHSEYPDSDEEVYRSANNQSSNSIAEKINLELFSKNLIPKDELNRYVYYRSFQKDNDTLTFRAKLEDFVKSISNQTFFDQFLIIRGEKDQQEIAYQTFQNIIEINSEISVLSDSSSLISGVSRNIIINDTKYRTFFHQFQFKEKDDWILVGLIKNDLFVKKTRSIDSVIILNAALIILILIVSMPLLKIGIMSPIERLKTHNVFFTGMSVVIGAPLIILTFLILLNVIYDKSQVEQKLDRLSKELLGNFNKEITNAYKQLENYELALIGNDTLKKMEVLKPNILRETSLIHNYPYYNEAFWMDHAGNQSVGFTPYSQTVGLQNLENREYFQRAIQNNFWNLTEDKKLFMQSITSWTTGLPEIAISKKTEIDSLPVAVITTKLNSLMNVILPLGYHFALVNDTGDVLIHSELAKSNQENFLKEVDDHEFLLSEIDAHSSMVRKFKYLERDILLMTSPLKNMPLTMLVYYDLDHSNISQAEVWISALVLIFLSFISCGMVLIIIFICRYKSTNLEFKPFFLSWMQPKIEKTLVIRKLTVSNFLAILITLLFFAVQGSDLSNKILSVSILPVLVLIMTYLNLTQTDNYKFIIGAFLALLIINVIHATIFYSNFQAYVYQAFILITFHPGISYQKIYNLTEQFLTRLKVNISKLDSFRRFRLDYNVMLLFWLLTTSVLPVFYFNNVSFEHVSSTIAREELLGYMSQKEMHYKDLKRDISKLKSSQYHPIDTLNKELVHTKFYKGIYSMGIKDSIDDNIRVKNLPDSLQSFDLFSKIKIKFSTLLKSPKLFVLDAADDKFTWIENTDSNDSESELIKYTYQNPFIPHQLSVDYASIVPNDEFYGFSSDGLKLVNIVNIMLFAGLVIFLFVVIRFATTRIYAMYPIFKPGYLATDPQSIIEILQHHNVLLLGHANSGRTSFVKKNLGKKLNFTFDMMKLNDKEQWLKLTSFTSSKKFEIAILDNFEYLYHDHIASNKKLRLLELLLINKKKVVIITETDPKEIMDYYVQEISNSSDEETVKKYSSDLEVWRHIFSNFIKTYKPINPIDSKVALDINVNLGDPKLSKVVKSELGYGTYLPYLANALNKKKKYLSDGITPENIILEIQQLADPYYTALWNTLTIEERFVIYDMAKNDFVNVKNKSTILTLLKKGMVKYENGLRLFNDSFRNFVLQANKGEALAMEKIVKQKGSWSKIRNILLLVILGLIVLIGFGQPDFFQNINSVFLVLTGIISFLPAINNMLSFSQRAIPK